MCWRTPLLADPAWKAGFVSESDSYKAWSGNEVAKQNGEAAARRNVRFLPVRLRFIPRSGGPRKSRAPVKHHRAEGAPR